MSEQIVLDFWFKELAADDWFKKDLNLDQKIRDRFFDLYIQATQGELSGWRKTISGRLGEIIILDQFSRNIFRNKPEAFRYDALALILSQEANGIGVRLANAEEIHQVDMGDGVRVCIAAIDLGVSQICSAPVPANNQKLTDRLVKLVNASGISITKPGLNFDANKYFGGNVVSRACTSVQRKRIDYRKKIEELDDVIKSNSCAPAGGLTPDKNGAIR
jgi:hypothetical protein